MKCDICSKYLEEGNQAYERHKEKMIRLKINRLINQLEGK